MTYKTYNNDEKDNRDFNYPKKVHSVYSTAREKGVKDGDKHDYAYCDTSFRPCCCCVSCGHEDITGKNYTSRCGKAQKYCLSREEDLISFSMLEIDSKSIAYGSKHFWSLIHCF